MKPRIAALTALVVAPILAQAQAEPNQAVVGRAPRLEGSAWYNAAPADAARLSSFRGHVTVLHFWTFECINCKHNLPYIAALAKELDPNQVQIIGIHTPETRAEARPTALRSAIERLGVTYPVLMDSGGANWANYDVDAWPTIFVIDKFGMIRAKIVGELGYRPSDRFAQLKALIQKLAAESK